MKTLLLGLACAAVLAAGCDSSTRSAVQPTPAAPTRSAATNTPAPSTATVASTAGTTGAAGAPTLLSLSSPVSVGASASAVVQTSPNAACVLSYRTPAGTVSQARGVGAATADGAGRAHWSWVIGTATRPGTGEITVTCASQTVRAPIEVR